MDVKIAELVASVVTMDAADVNQLANLEVANLSPDSVDFAHALNDYDGRTKSKRWQRLPTCEGSISWRLGSAT